MRPKIIVHCLIKNEENFIWYALKSVLPYVDKILVWDTGSTDNSVKIVKTISSPKIHFQQVNNVTANNFPRLRQKMLEATPKSCDWLMILDGDEVWPEKSIKAVVSFINKNSQFESIVVRTNNLIGDIYHRLPASAGRYNFIGQTGHLALRFINLKKIKGLHVDLPYGQEGYFDQSNQLIQNRDPNKIKILDKPYHHATHLRRSSHDQSTLKRDFKFKYELGQKIPQDEVPEIFFESHPTVVPEVTKPASRGYWLKSSLITPFKIIKRLLIMPKSGY